LYRRKKKAPKGLSYSSSELQRQRRKVEGVKFRHRHGIAFIVSPISEEESGIGWQNHASDLALAMVDRLSN
jgi:hypothetical protein